MAAALPSLGQVSILTGTTGATFTTPTVPTMAYSMNYSGNNRLMVVVVAGKVNAGTIGTITSVTYNGTAMTAVTTTAASTASQNVRVGIFRLTESQIRTATAGACSSNIVVNWSVLPDNTIIQAMTFKDVDQTTPIAGSSANANANGTTSNSLALTAIAVAADANDAIILGSVSDAAKTMSIATAGYAMVTASQTVGTVAMGVAMKSGAAASESPTATWNTPTASNSSIGDAGIRINGIATITQSQTTYYSLASGAWDANTSWSTSANGSSGALPTGVWPQRTDNVVIRSGHTITIDAMDDNKACGVLPDALSTGPAPVGSFTSSNTAMFYQSGNIDINGTLVTTTGVQLLVSGYTHVLSGGTLNTTSVLVNLGNLEVDNGSTLMTGDDLIISGASTTTINTTSVSSDDLILDHTIATLCGSGTQQLTNGGSSIITYANGVTVAQICSSFTVTCSGGGCAGTFPTAGTGATPLGNAGPGGVGSSSTNRLWLRSSDLALANNASVTSWADASGNGLTAAAQAPPSSANQPTFLTNNVNGIIPGVNFRGTDLLTLGTPAVLDFIPQTNTWTFVAAGNVNTNASGTYISKATNANRQYQYTVDSSTPNRFGEFTGGTFVVGTQTATGAWKIPVATTPSGTTGVNTFVNGTADLTNQGIGTTTAPSPTDVLIGARRNNTNADAGFNLTGVLGEVIMYNVVLTTAQRNLVENYLAAKYAISGLATELYTMDNAGNGNYDFDVAGIAQIAGGGNHKDAKGSGVVRIWNPSDLNDGEYLTWGRDNSVFNQQNTSDVDGTVIQGRLSRVWRVSESAGDVGTVNISFALSGLNGSFVGSNLRLLISRSDAVFATNDVAPITGTYSNGIMTFTGVNFQDGDRFTIGNTNNSFPLPISLIKFTAQPLGARVMLDWVTATEHDNDFFTVERSGDGEGWEKVLDVRGAGNSTKELKYHAEDIRPLRGVSYYRLKQTDYNGDHAYSAIVKVTVSDDEVYDLIVYPNPTTGVFTIDVGFDVSADQVRMFDTMGKQIAIDIKAAGKIATIDSSQIASGIYIVQVVNGFWRKSIRIIKN